MKTIGIIAEYNPFHNGHLYQINKIKEKYKNSTIIVVMSGCFMQRGEPSIIDKWSKTEIILNNKVDLVVELPFYFATQSADLFAKGAISLLKELKIDILYFGSEENNIEKLTTLAKIQLNNKEYKKLIKEYLKEGINYPTAQSKALEKINKSTINTPNDILGVSYIREIIKENTNIIPKTIKRTCDYHSTKINNKISSATSIRLNLKKKKSIKKQVPKETYKCLKKANLHFKEDYFQLLKYKILSENDLSIYQTVDEGIENRIKKFIIKSNNIEELTQNIKTKRYTYNKINRMFIHILCNFTKEEAKKNKEIKYIRILGFNEKGKNYLNKIKKELKLPLITNYTKLLENELKITSIYASTLKEKEKIKLIEKEYKNNIIKKFN